MIDRFYAINGQIKGHYKKAAYLMTYADTSSKEAEPMLVHYRTLMEYLGGKAWAKLSRQAYGQQAPSATQTMENKLIS